jgi:TP901 family phage tail tape measure protein
MAAADTARLIAELTLKDKLSAGVTSAIRSVDKLDKRLSKVGSIASKGFSNAARNIERAAVGIGVAMAGGVVAAVKVAADFESQLNTINTIARETPEALGKIGDQIRQVARDTGTPLEDLTQGYYDLLSAGVQAADSQKVLVAANTLAIGGLSTTAEAIDLLTTTINTYGGDATKAASYSDVFAKAIERGKVTAAEFAGSFATIGPTAAAFGIEVEEIGASFARLTAAGVPASEAATQMAAAIKALAKPGGPLKALQKETGKSYLEIAGKQGLVSALEQMRVDAKKSGVDLITLFGRLEGFNFALQTTGPNFDAYNADLTAMGNASGTAAAQMSERQQGLNFQLSRLKALAKDAGITIGSALIPKLVPLVEKFNQFITNNQEGIKRFGTDLANAFQGAAEWIAKLDFKQIGDSLKIAGTFAKILVQSFLAAPQWLQTAVVTGWGLNKLTGGAVTGIFGELAKGLIKGVLSMNAGVVNINAATVNGLGGVPGAAGGGGALGLLLKGIFPAAVTLAIGYAIGDAVVQAMGGALTAPEQQTGTGRIVGEIAGLEVVMGQNYGALVRNTDALKRQTEVAKRGVEGPEMFGPPKGFVPKMGGLSPGERDEQLTAIMKRALAAGRTPKDPVAAAQATLGRNQLREQEKTKAAVNAVKLQEAKTTAAALLTAAAVQRIDRQPPTVNVTTNVRMSAGDIIGKTNARVRVVKPNGPRHAIGTGPLQ